MEIEQKTEGSVRTSTGRYWYSDSSKMASLAADKQITQFEAGHHYTYNIVLKTNSGYFISEDTSVSAGGHKFDLKYRNMELLQGVLGSLRPAVVAMIASAGILIMISAFWGSAPAISFEETKWSMVVIFILCVISLRKTKINPVWVMVLAGLMKAGLALTGQWG